ncbi:alpha-(1,3)-fucosyltransferase C [Rhipicephalus sanguineus]|uniref:alpha-(1,3)-fucosyltransferase C n=1 Tax=Rhipicephalus sanguineus TaxID=34632 RepID=UPI001894C5F4|nr:alpha-(1,3)-fucosyltransferase C [Rhipicephalus sanguineus]
MRFTLATTWRTRLLHIRRRCERVFRENRKASYVRAAFQLAKEWSDVLPFISMLLLTGVSAFVPLMVMRYWKDVVEESRRGIPWRPWYERDLRSNGSMDDEADNPRILAWAASAFHWEPEEPTPTSDERLLERCSVRADQSPCFITRDRNYLRRADAILFDTSSVNYRDVPTYRHKGQVWVILDRGQPLKEASNDLRLMTAEFNWTMSQRDDADVIVPYRSWTTVPSNKSLDNFNRSFKSKPRASLWLVSKCEADQIHSSAKTIENITTEFQFAHSVANASSAHIVENCGGIQCQKNLDSCLRQFQKQYCFVFVVDSSPCFQHPKKLLFGALQHSIIPVYFGRSRLGNTVPPMSVLQATAAPTVGHVLKEMFQIYHNFKYYSAYTTWKENYVIIKPKNDLCALCDALYESRRSTSSNDVVEWLGRSQERKESCNDHLYPKNISQAKEMVIPIRSTFREEG